MPSLADRTALPQIHKGKSQEFSSFPLLINIDCRVLRDFEYRHLKQASHL